MKKIGMTILLTVVLAGNQGFALGGLRALPLKTIFITNIEKKIVTDEQELPPETDTEFQKSLIRNSIFFGVPTLTYFFAIAAWGWGDRETWLWANEGWFGQNTYSGGADKAAHLYSHYLTMRATYNIFNYTENGSSSKWLYSMTLTGLIGLGIEVGDSHAGQNGFSFEDLIVDVLGIGLGSLLERFPAVDAFMSLSAEYVPTRYFRENPGDLWLFPDDYSGWKFMANIKFAGFFYLGFDLPEFLRYLMIDVGYFSRGYTSHDAYYGSTDPKRYWFIGFSVNMMEVINRVFNRDRSLLNRALQQPVKYYHLPLGLKYEHEL